MGLLQKSTFLCAAAVGCLLCGGPAFGAEDLRIIDLLRECGEDPSCNHAALTEKLEPVDASTLAALRKATLDDDPGIRKTAVSLLGSTGDTCYRLMARLLDDEDEGIREAAEEALKETGKVPASVLEDLYRKERYGSPTRARILRVFGSSCDPDGLALIHESAVKHRRMELPSQNEEREAEVAVLGSCGEPSMPHLYNLLKYGGDLWRQAGVALREMPVEESGAALLSMALEGDEDRETRMHWALWAEKLLGPARVWEVLVPFYDETAADESASAPLRKNALDRRQNLLEAPRDGSLIVAPGDIGWWYKKKELKASAPDTQERIKRIRHQRAAAERRAKKEQAQSQLFPKAVEPKSRIQRAREKLEKRKAEEERRENHLKEWCRQQWKEYHACNNWDGVICTPPMCNPNN